MKSATILLKIVQTQECSTDTAYALTKALKEERLLHRKLFIRLKPLYHAFDVVDFDYTDYTEGGGVDKMTFAHSIADITDLYEVLPEINAEYAATEKPITMKFIHNQCCKNNWFTCGSIEQYNKLFDMVREGSLLETLADCISVHSDNVSSDAVYEILEAALGGGGI